MKNKMKNKTMISIALLITSITVPAAYAGSTRHFSEAAGHSTQAGGHSVVGTAKLASSVVTVPLIIIGGIGHVSQRNLGIFQTNL